MIYTLDTNVFVDALRQPAEMERLKGFLRWALPTTVLSSIVASELVVGARTERARRILSEAVLAPFERRGRIVAPSQAAWHRAGVVLSAAGPVTRLLASRYNDTLLATQAREHGWMVITRDGDLWTLRQRISGLHVTAPFPDQ